MEKWIPYRTNENKVRMIFNDFVIRHDVCNFKCDYCLNLVDPYSKGMWENQKLKVLASDMVTPPKENEQAPVRKEPLIYSSDSSLGKRMDKMLKSFNAAFDVAILRLSGGEVLQIRGVEDFIEKNAADFEIIQIVTNGYFLTDRMIDRLSAIKNFHMHFSLDGNKLEHNSLRFQSDRIHDRLLLHLDNSVKAGIPIEINCVLTQANTKHFMGFLDYLKQYEENIVVYPSPVRGRSLRNFYPDEESRKIFSEILAVYDRYESLLPPIAYMKELISFMNREDGSRSVQCHFPKAGIQSIDDGVVTPCPNGWFTQLGNLHKEDPQEVAARIDDEKTYKLLLLERPRMDYCKICHSAYDVVSLFVSGRISDDEMARMPLYAGPKVTERLRYLRDEFLQQKVV